ncbi:MAG: hypothetical protein HY438_01335 [DPANN group archaeon]|nr:hypothetical protein [DPANN group archaeon]
MRKLATLAIALVVAAVIILLYLSSQPAKAAKDSKSFCSSDSDCARAECCHSSSAVSRGFAPDCKDVLCTAVCQPKTTDCGQGKIKCVRQECRVVLNG